MQLISDERLAELLRHHGIKGPFIASWEKPSFYENGMLVHVSDRQAEHLFLASEEFFGPVNGSALRISEFNAVAGLRITEDTVLDYMKFFCAGIEAPHGRFIVVETDQLSRASDHITPIDFRPFRLTSVTPDKFTMSATVLYADNLFYCEMSADTRGTVDMIGDEGGIPVYRLNS